MIADFIYKTMREIIFRAWDKRFKNMAFGGGALLLRINENDFSEPMQYTGLKDKNSKMIFEGDIVTIKGFSDGLNKNVFHYLLIKDIREVFLLFNISNALDADLEIEIIGNQFQTPELLTKTNTN